MKKTETIQIIPGISADRHKTLADGVFTVAMTLLVLELSIPVIREATNQDLTATLLSMWPKFLSYALSFLILGVFWIIHHFIFDSVRYYDTTLAWLNIMFLLFVALVPFTTSLLGEYFLEITPTIIYGVQLLLMFIMGFSLYSYISSKKSLVDSEISPKIVKGAKKMGYLYFTILLAAIIIALFNTLISTCIYGLIVILFIIFTALGRGEHVVILPVSAK
ncbi:MAG: DUF1211 domain-containing protein [Bacteroidales bacterium]|nr:MAG: DUF1211 domain-containing protein [Bacteroidales bacterium]